MKEEGKKVKKKKETKIFHLRLFSIVPVYSVVCTNTFHASTNSNLNNFTVTLCNFWNFFNCNAIVLILLVYNKIST